jgi:hypothetical protein
VFVFFISGHKAHNPAAAEAMLARLPGPRAPLAERRNAWSYRPLTCAGADDPSRAGQRQEQA